MRTLGEQLQKYPKTLVYYKFTADLINKIENIKNTMEVLELEKMKIWLKAELDGRRNWKWTEDRTIKIIQSQKNRIKDHLQSKKMQYKKSNLQVTRAPQRIKRGAEKNLSVCQKLFPNLIKERIRSKSSVNLKQDTHIHTHVYTPTHLGIIVKLHENKT